ncbi:MAG: hypothetical protein M1814_000013 [Vezdaea aestivalis]|nr:MAG: hypothetical protein M1814_000013 [Vezdaea aestivalis]
MEDHKEVLSKVASDATSLEAAKPPFTVLLLKRIDGVGGHNLGITYNNSDTPLFCVSRSWSLSFKNTVTYHQASLDNPPLCTASTNRSFSQPKSNIELAFTPANSTPYTLKLQRLEGALKRRHEVQLSDGVTYIVRGKRSESLLWYIGDLVVEDSQGNKVADFESNWWFSFHSAGFIRIFGAHSDTFVQEIAFVITSLCIKEYRKAMTVYVT